MKKILAIALSLVLVMGLSVTAFAAKSPNGTTYHKVVTIQNDSAKPETHNVVYTADAAGSITLTAQKASENDVFVGWSIYKKDGTAATEGTDYEVKKTSNVMAQTLNVKAQRGLDPTGVDLSLFSTVATLEGQTLLTDTTITIVPKTDLIIAANWNSKLTSIKTATSMFDETSDKTGDSSAVFAVALAVLALGGLVASKKQLAK